MVQLTPYYLPRLEASNRGPNCMLSSNIIQMYIKPTLRLWFRIICYLFDDHYSMLMLVIMHAAVEF